jgi:hypothetical protein
LLCDRRHSSVARANVPLRSLFAPIPFSEDDLWNGYPEEQLTGFKGQALAAPAPATMLERRP